MPQFNIYPALQARTFDIQDIQRQSLQNQLLQSKVQQAQNPQPDPRLALDREKFEFSQDKDQRTQGLQHTKVLGQYAGAAAQASGVQRVMIHGEAVKYAQANGIPTDGWLDPSDPNYVAWAQAQQARAGEAEKQAGGFTLSPGQVRYGAGGKKIASRPAKVDSKEPKGLGIGESYNSLLEEKAYLDAGQQVPPDVANRAAAARHVLTTKRYTQTPEGTQSYTPGIPPGFGGQAGALTSPGPTGAPEPEAEPASDRSLQMEVEKESKVDVGLPVSTIRKISELLNDPSGENITGVVGTAKRFGGGLARQAGIPVSERAERLQRLLETLQGQMGPIILNEKRLSETERARLERIVGNVSPTMDEQALRSALADLVDFIASVGKR